MTIIPELDGDVLTRFRDLENDLHRHFQNNSDKGISYNDAVKILSIPRLDLMRLFAFSNSIKEQFYDNKVKLCSIVNAKSGNCSEDCSFCSQSKFNHSTIEKYPMRSNHEIVTSAIDAEKNGAQNFGIVTSGHRLSRIDFRMVLDAVSDIKNNTNLAVCGSLGVLSIDQLKQLKVAGLDKYHHNLETSRSYFKKICTTHSYEERLAMVKRVKKAEIQICSGGIIGLGESPGQRLELAETLAELDVDSVPLNILVPIPGTKLAEKLPIAPLEILKTIAIFRLMLPTKLIKVAGGREKNLRDLQGLALLAGANGFLIGNYLTMPGQSTERDIKLIHDLGLQCEHSKEDR